MIDQSVKIWQPSNINPAANIGKNVQIGAFTEIGPNVNIGDNVRIGAFCFIPEGVTIEDNAWIGPGVFFTNDRFPPSLKAEWEKTTVEQGARLGARVTVICGVLIGKNSLIGAGAVVTKNVPAGFVYAGVPARPVKVSGMTAYDYTEDDVIIKVVMH